MESLNLSSSPQFSKMEPGQPPQCRLCKQPVVGPYYTANDAVLCGPCGERLSREGHQDRPGVFVRALLAGIVAAIIGLALYAGFTILTGIYIGYVSLAVGFIIGKGITMGSGGVGGRKYQIAAIILTYAAVSMAAIPIAFHQIKVEKPNQQEQKQAAPPSSDSAGTADKPATGQPAKGESMSFGEAIGKLALIGLASPFLELADEPGGIIGLIILFVGLRIAWKITAQSPVQVSGPFQSASAASAGAPR
jgi:hypothetical protein